MLNRVILLGRLTRDPELKTTQSGISVASFSLAVERDYTPKGEGEKGVDFINVDAWRHTADFVGKYLSKGRMVAVSGRLQIEKYEDKSGNKRQRAVVVADNVYFADSKQSNGEAYGGERKQTAPASTQYHQFQTVDEDDDMLPF